MKWGLTSIVCRDSFMGDKCASSRRVEEVWVDVGSGPRALVS